MTSEKSIGILLMLGAIGVLVPYTILTATFNYPDILRQDPGMILAQFHQGGNTLIFTWLAFATMGSPLLIAYIMLGRKLETKLPFVRWITTIGVISTIVQMIGLLRWVFVVPVLAREYVGATNEATQQSLITAFTLIHQFAGVLMGEHLGQLFTVVWTIGMSYALRKIGIIPAWIAWLGFIASGIYITAQAELLATIIPGFPAWEAAGFLGSSLWLIWLVLVGIQLCKPNTSQKFI
jgi:hypothetical protein